MGATNTLDRMAAMLGDISEVSIEFQTSIDVPNGGVLFALPALLAIGLLQNTQKHFQLPNGYYGLDSLFLLLAFMSLVRIKSIEKCRYCAPGEGGNLLGLDRLPEVRTLRSKVKIRSEQGAVAQWMAIDLEDAAILYIDGQVRVYQGSQTKLPRHYVARQRLCLRATTDYGVNAREGQPFFFINKAVDPGLIKVVENEIVPRLGDELPHQPSPEQLNDDPLLPCSTLVFDREGYRPEMMLRLKKKHVACITYHKYPGEDGSRSEFGSHPVRLVTGDVVEMMLAERGTYLGKKLWLRELRKLTKSGPQTAVIATHYHMDFITIAVSMFARGSPENFFR